MFSIRVNSWYPRGQRVGCLAVLRVLLFNPALIRLIRLQSVPSVVEKWLIGTTRPALPDEVMREE